MIHFFCKHPYKEKLKFRLFDLLFMEESTHPVTKEENELHSIRQMISSEKIETIDRRDLEEIKIRGERKTSRIPTGIPGLDDLLKGGFLPRSVVMISGEAGTGKTIFCTQFIWNALCIGENGVIISLQQTPEEVKTDVAIFGRDFKRAEELGQVRIIYVEPQDVKKIIGIILKNVKQIQAKRLVIDSITLICEYFERPRYIRENLGRLFTELKKMGVTTLVTSEVEEGTNLLSKNGIEEFLVDGVIVLKVGVDVVGGKPRSLFIKKMRRTNHDLNTHPFEITDRGIKIII